MDFVHYEMSALRGDICRENLRHIALLKDAIDAIAIDEPGVATRRILTVINKLTASRESQVRILTKGA